MRHLLSIAALLISGQGLAHEGGSCIPLEVVGGEVGQTIVYKTVSAPSAIFFQSNWNTDFVVPSSIADQDAEYWVNLMSWKGDGGKYSTEIRVKYPDDSNSLAFKGDSEFYPENRFEKRFTALRGKSPYQINVNVGSIGDLGKHYAVSVDACIY